MKALSAKSDVASDVVKNDAGEDSNKTATDILQNEKPS